MAFDSVYAQFKDTILQATGNVDIMIRSVEDTSFKDTILTTVREIEGVVNASARMSNTVLVSQLEGEGELATLIGVDSRTDFDYLESVNVTGKLPFITPRIEFLVGGKEAIVDEGLNYTIGDQFFVYLLSDEPEQDEWSILSRPLWLTVVGIHHPTQPSAGHSIYVDLVTAQKLCECQGEINSILVQVVDIELTDQIVSDLYSRLDPTFIVNPIKASLLDSMRESTSGLDFGLKVMSALALCVAVVIVLNTVYMNVGERTREVGILRSAGASTRQVFWVFFSEILTLGIVGAAIGVVAGILVTNLFLYITSTVFGFVLSDFAAVPFSENLLPNLVIGASAGVVTAVVGGILPSLSACRINVIQALRPTMRKAGNPRTALKLMAIGLPLTLVGLFIYVGGILEVIEVGFLIASLLAPVTTVGVIFVIASLLRSANPLMEYTLILFQSTRKIISRNIDRNLFRSTACFTLIGVSLSFIVVMGGAQTGIVEGIEEIIRSFAISDIIVVSETRISSSFAEDLTFLDNNSLIRYTAPALVIPERTLLVNKVSSTTVSAGIIVIDPISYPAVMSMQFSEETPHDVFTQLDLPGQIILTTPLATSLDVTVGDTISVGRPNGAITTWINFTIVGLAEGAWFQMMSFGGFSLSEACYISYVSNNEFFSEYKNESNLFFIKIKADQDVDHIKDRILDSYRSEYQLGLVTYNEVLGGVSTGIDQIFIIFNALVIFAVINAIIGVTSIMVMNVTTRQREIGILRSQGVSNAQVVTSIIGEGVTLSVVGFVMGTILGLIFHQITVSYMRLTGFEMPYLIPFDSIGLSLVLAILTSILSAAYPAYRASKLNIIDALRR
jgi:putative ABC transport system permease protein